MIHCLYLVTCVNVDWQWLTFKACQDEQLLILCGMKEYVEGWITRKIRNGIISKEKIYKLSQESRNPED